MMACSHSFHMLISNYFTETDRHSVVTRIVYAIKLVKLVKYYVFVQILALCRKVNLTNPIRQLYTSSYSVYSCLIGLVVLTGWTSAMNLAKSLIVSEKNYFNHCAPMQWNGSFWSKFHLPAPHTDSILKRESCCSILLKESNYRSHRVSDGFYC
jgi:hypothetical protein